MDLTKNFPRGPRERLDGVAMLARTIDKARAQLAGTLGEYIYDCPMDKQLFSALGVNAYDFLGAVGASSEDSGVLAWLRGRRAIPDGEALRSHNDAIEQWKPKSDRGRARFLEQREQLAPGRSHITTWTELIDIEEGRAALPAG